jgi:hypothetical protein
MGYTHYWKLNNKGNEKNFKAAKADIKKILKAKINLLANAQGEKDTNPDTNTEILFNGIEKESHETFYLPNKLSDLVQPNYTSDPKSTFVFNFCKTARKKYDVIVVACLTVLKAHLLNDVEVSSDGDYEELECGHILAEEVLGKKLPHPLDPTPPQSIQYILEEDKTKKKK